MKVRRAEGAPGNQAARRRDVATKEKTMWLIVLEALGALALLVFIVWWTMFSGRRGGEQRRPDDEV